jgi:acyl dehydratase
VADRVVPELRAGLAPFFEDLEVGMLDLSAPAVTLTEGLAAVHQAIVGDRLRLALDLPLARRVLGAATPLAHPALVWDVAIGQSTFLTQRVIANLFYRGLVLSRAPVIGDTLRTTTEVVGLRQTTPREDRPATGLAALRVRTLDQMERPVLDFWRCAMLPLRDRDGRTNRADSLDGIPAQLDRELLAAATIDFRLREMPPLAGPRFGEVEPGERWPVERGDVVSAAPELARLSLNLAGVHHDQAVQKAGRRLVYGGHTIGIAAAQATRLLPNIATIVGWHSCDHPAPVYEGDTLHSELRAERVEPTLGGGLVDLRSLVSAHRDEGVTKVLDWRFVALMV